MPQTRISDDVWTLAEQVSDRMGLNSPRLAIEAIVRVCASHYTSNSLQPHAPIQPLKVQSVKPIKPEAIEPAATDAASELSNLMQSFT
jgi:hypothetical protein